MNLSLNIILCLILSRSMPEIRPGFPPNSMPSSSTATVTTQHQKGPVIGPQVPKPLFPAAQVSLIALV